METISSIITFVCASIIILVIGGIELWQYLLLMSFAFFGGGYIVYNTQTTERKVRWYARIRKKFNKVFGRK